MVATIISGAPDRQPLAVIFTANERPRSLVHGEVYRLSAVTAVYIAEGMCNRRGRAGVALAVGQRNRVGLTSKHRASDQERDDFRARVAVKAPEALGLGDRQPETRHFFEFG